MGKDAMADSARWTISNFRCKRWADILSDGDMSASMLHFQRKNCEEGIVGTCTRFSGASRWMNDESNMPPQGSCDGAKLKATLFPEGFVSLMEIMSRHDKLRTSTIRIPRDVLLSYRDCALATPHDVSPLCDVPPRELQKVHRESPGVPSCSEELNGSFPAVTRAPLCGLDESQQTSWGAINTKRDTADHELFNTCELPSSRAGFNVSKGSDMGSARSLMFSEKVPRLKSDSGHVFIKNSSLCTKLNASVLKYRERQIAIAKGSRLYCEYLREIPKEARSPHDPETPRRESGRSSGEFYDLLQRWKHQVRRRVDEFKEPSELAVPH